MDVIHRLLQQLLRFHYRCVQALGGFGVFLQQLQVDADGRQRLADFVVQFAADAPALLLLGVQDLAGKLAQFILHCLGLFEQVTIMLFAPAHRFLGPLAAGRITANGVNNRFIGRAGGRPMGPSIQPVLAAGAHFVRHHRGTGFQTLEFRRGSLAVIRMDQIEVGAAQQFFRLVTEGFRPGGIDTVEAAIKPGQAEHIDGDGEEAIKLLLDPFSVNPDADLIGHRGNKSNHSRILLPRFATEEFDDGHDFVLRQNGHGHARFESGLSRGARPGKTAVLGDVRAPHLPPGLPGAAWKTDARLERGLLTLLAKLFDTRNAAVPRRAAFQTRTVRPRCPGLSDHPPGQVLCAADGEGDGLEQPDLLLGPLALGNIADDTAVKAPPFRLPGRQGQFQRKFTSVPPDTVQLDRLANQPRRFTVADSLDPGRVVRSIAVRHQHADGMPHDLFQRPAEHRAGGLVAGDDDAVAVGQNDGVDGRLHQCAELFLAFPQRPLGPQSIRHVARHDDGVGDGGPLMVGVVTDVEIAPARRGHFKPGMVVHLFTFEALVEMGFDDVSEGGPAPEVFHGGAENFLPAFAMRLAISVVGGFVTVIRRDQREKFARGVDDGFVTFPHLFGGFAARNFVAELPIRGRQFGRPLFQRLVQVAQAVVGFMEAPVLRFKGR